jgi:hypothetical protein
VLPPVLSLPVPVVSGPVPAVVPVSPDVGVEPLPVPVELVGALEVDPVELVDEVDVELESESPLPASDDASSPQPTKKIASNNP